MKPLSLLRNALFTAGFLALAAVNPSGTEAQGEVGGCPYLEFIECSICIAGECVGLVCDDGSASILCD